MEEEYPEELRTPPVSLVALFGCSELHSSITTHLHSQQPPINALAFPDFSHLPLLLAPPPPPPHDHSHSSSFRDPLSSDSSSPTLPSGILKRDWLLKHRTKVPALVAAFFPSNHIFGDPTQWLQVCSTLDTLKYVPSPSSLSLFYLFIYSLFVSQPPLSTFAQIRYPSQKHQTCGRCGPVFSPWYPALPAFSPFSF